MAQATILLADDSSTVRTMISRVLGSSGYEVVLATDGVQALDLVKQNDIDLAILDIVMPELDGYEVCESLKSMGDPYCRIPILFLTCVESKALELMGDEFGAYLRKPVDTKVLLEAIEKNLCPKEVL